MQALLLALFIHGAGAATLHDLSDRLAIPPGERTPINLAQVNEVMRAEGAALPEVQNLNPWANPEIQEKIDESITGFFDSAPGKAMKGLNKVISDKWTARKNEWQASVPKPADKMPDHFDSDQDKRIWEAEQGNRIMQGNPVGDLTNALEGLTKMNDRAQARIQKKFSFMEKKADVTKSEPETKKEQKADKEAEAMTESVVEPKTARKEEDKVVESSHGGWDITFYVLLTACVFVFGWWAIKIGWHERAAEAAKEFAFQCKKAFSTILKSGDSHGKMNDEKSESSYEASEGTTGSESSKGALNSHLQGVIDRVKGTMDQPQKK